MLFKEITSVLKWETFVLKYNPQSLFQSWNWGEVEKNLGKKVYRYGIYNNTDSHINLIGISQIIVVQAKRGTFLHVRHGPIFKKWDPLLVQGWLKHVIQLAHTEKAWFIRISPLISPDHKQKLRETGFKDAPIHSMDAEMVRVLSLSDTEEQLFLHMRKTTRYLIRKAEKIGVSVRKADDIESFLRLYKQTSSRHNFIPHPGITEEYLQFKKSGQAELYFTYYQNTLLSAALILFYGNQAIYHHGASVQSVIPASYLLQWQVIRDAKKRGMDVYNFWGITDKDNKKHPWWGLTQFKNGFGGSSVSHLHAQDYPVHLYYIFPYLIETVRKRIRGY